MILDIKHQGSKKCGFRQEDFSCFTLYKSKKDVKDQDTIQSSTTPDPGYRMGK